MTRVFEGVVFWCGRQMERKVGVLEIVFELDTMLLLLVAADAEIKARAAGHGRYEADRKAPAARRRLKRNAQRRAGEGTRAATWRRSTTESRQDDAPSQLVTRLSVTCARTCHFRRCGKFEANCHTSCTTTSSLSNSSRHSWRTHHTKLIGQHNQGVRPTRKARQRRNSTDSTRRSFASTSFLAASSSTFFLRSCRRLLPRSRVDGLTVREGVQLRRIKLVFMSLWLTGLRTTNLLQS